MYEAMGRCLEITEPDHGLIIEVLDHMDSVFSGPLDLPEFFYVYQSSFKTLAELHEQTKGNETNSV